MKKRICSIMAFVLLALMLFSACGELLVQNHAESAENGTATNLNNVASYTGGIAGSISAGSILDWVYQTIPGGGMPATSSYVTVDDKFTNTFTTSSTTFYSIPATNTTYLSLSGLPHPNNNGGKYYRLNYASMSSYPTAVQSLATKTAGVAVRFCTNATTLAIEAQLQNCNVEFNHMAPKGIYGFDVYVGTGSNRTWVTNTQSQLVMTDVSKDYNTSTKTGSMTSSVTLPDGYKEVLICFPQYGGVTSVNIGLPSGAQIAAPTARSAKDILFYGTSITQGACSNRAGTSYTNILGRKLDADVYNLGFAENGKGEAVMAQHIANLVKTGEISAVVLDFEHNNATHEEVAENHYNFYKIIRAANANIPILLLTRPIYTSTPTKTDLTRHSIVSATYQRAVAAGDTNIFMLNGYEYFTPVLTDSFTVDGTHPNDLGHNFMANKVYPYLYEMLYGNVSKIPAPKLGEYSGYQSYYAEFAYADGAKIATNTWSAGVISATMQTGNTEYDQTTNIYKNGGMYSHSSILTFPKKGTKVWYSLDSKLYVPSSVARISYVTSGGAFDTTREPIVGEKNTDASTSSYAFKLLYNNDGSVTYWHTPYDNNNRQYFCYITQQDNESFRFCANLNNNALSPTIYYCEPEGPTLYLKNQANYTKELVSTNWTGNKHLQWDSGILNNDLSFAVSDAITIAKAGTTIVWFDDSIPDPGYDTNGTACKGDLAYAGGTVSVMAFDSTGNTVLRGSDNAPLLRIRANNGDDVTLGGSMAYFDTLDSKMRVYYYTTTTDNETIRISYYAGFDTDPNNSNQAFYVPPYNVYMYVPKN